MTYAILEGDCLQILREGKIKRVDLTIFDPPFNQDKDYDLTYDKLDEESYWQWIYEVVLEIYKYTSVGGAIYFMQRDKNLGEVYHYMKKAGWIFQNLIIWRKMTSPTPQKFRYAKRYQALWYGTKGKIPKRSNILHSRTPMLSWHKREEMEKDTRIDDLWYNIRELTAGCFTGNEVIRDENGDKIHYQQMSLELAVRMILFSTMPNDLVLDPMAGSGTSLVAASQMNRRVIAIDISPQYVEMMQNRIYDIRSEDNVIPLLEAYNLMFNIDEISGIEGLRTQQSLSSYFGE